MKNNLPVTKEELENALTKLEAKLEAKMVTKTDAKLFLTKTDAKNFATKDDLKQFATKDDLRQFATKDDLNKAEKSIRALARLDLEGFKQEINEKLNLLPTKDEFFTQMDEVMGELKAIREEQSVTGYRLANHDDRIVVLEQKVGVVTV